MTWGPPVFPTLNGSPMGWSHPANDPHTEHRMRITWLEVRMDKLERTTEASASKREPRKSPMAVIKDWMPLIVPIAVMLLAFAGKLKWSEALPLIRTLLGGS